MASGSIQPLSIGNVVSTAIRVYGAHLKQYLGIAAIATAWGLIPFAIAVLLIGMIVTGATTNSPVLIGLGIFLFLPWIALLIFCIPPALSNTATISRLVYGELVEKPESTTAAREQVSRRRWTLFLTTFLVGLILGGINFGLTIVFQYIPVFASALIFGSESPIASIVILLGNLVSIVIYYWFFARWFIPDVLIAVETNLGADGAIGRSWQLSKGYATRILLIIIVALLITAPFFVLSFVPVFIAIFSNLAFFSATSPDPDTLPAFFASFGIALVATFLLYFAVNLFVMPFWQSLKAVIYCDLRSRQEGLGLQLRDRQPRDFQG